MQVAVHEVVHEDHLGHRVHAQTRELLARARIARGRIDEGGDGHAGLEAFDKQVARREARERLGNHDRVVLCKVCVQPREVPRLLPEVELPEHLQRKVLYHIGQREPLERGDARQHLRHRPDDVDVHLDDRLDARVDHLDGHVDPPAALRVGDGAAAVDLRNAARANHVGLQLQLRAPVLAQLGAQHALGQPPRVRRHVVVQLLERLAEFDREEVVPAARPLGELDERRAGHVHRTQRVRPQCVLERGHQPAERERERHAERERRVKQRERDQPQEHAHRAA
mmetsp:Transcript_17140/g.53285  ORF Transcript_17140/g.53285 Transcript_17140/m.53285 type:complete len:282 (+) Transcript_17140:741-1586(+)